MKRRANRRFVRSQQGRQGLWFRHGRYSPFQSEAGSSIYANTVVYEALWSRHETGSITQAKRKGGPILTSLFGMVNVTLNVDSNDSRLYPELELLIYVDTEDGDPIVNAADYYAMMDTKRVLHYSLTLPQVAAHWATNVAPISDEAFMSVSKSFNLKSKVALSGNRVVLAVKQNFDPDNSDINRHVTKATCSGYITTP